MRAVCDRASRRVRPARARPHHQRRRDGLHRLRSAGSKFLLLAARPAAPRDVGAARPRRRDVRARARRPDGGGAVPAAHRKYGAARGASPSRSSSRASPSRARRRRRSHWCPSSGAQGRFTTAVLSVTVLMDVIVVLLFAVTLLTVHAIAPEAGEAPGSPWQVLGLFGFQLFVSALVGLLLAAMLHALFRLSGACEALEGDGATNAPPTPTTRGAAARRRGSRRGCARGRAGDAVADGEACHLRRRVAAAPARRLRGVPGRGSEERQYGAALHNPLVISMISGFTIVNYTSSRKPFLRYAAAPPPCHPPPPCEAPRLSARNRRGSQPPPRLVGARLPCLLHAHRRRAPARLPRRLAPRRHPHVRAPPRRHRRGDAARRPLWERTAGAHRHVLDGVRDAGGRDARPRVARRR